VTNLKRTPKQAILWFPVGLALLSGGNVSAQSVSDRGTRDVSSRVDVLQSELDQARTQIRQQQAQIEQLQNSIQRVMKLLDQPRGPSPAAEQHVYDGVAPTVRTAALPVADTPPASSEIEGPASIRYKGLSLTPGGFLEGTVLVRTRNENADIANSYTGIPLNGTSNSKLSEYRGSARNSRFFLLLEGKAGTTRLSGFYEMDFLGAAPTANFLQASSFTPRLRQAWVQLDTKSGWTVTGGQFWSLITTNREGLEARKEYIPNTADGGFVVGYNWVRTRAFRVTRKLHNNTWLAFEMDDPENSYSAAFMPANVMGLNTSQNASTGVFLLPYLANYSNGNSTTIAPDLLAKAVFEPRWGHFEIKALGRTFRDRVASTATTVGQTNVTYGYGVGFAAILPLTPHKADLVVEGLTGQGIGRYGASGSPDVTLDPTNARMLPLRQAQVMAGIELHPSPKVDFYGYVGNEYTGRYAAVTSTGAAGGYGSPLVSYAGCTSEVAVNTCNGANRNIQETTFGYWYHMFRGRFGSMQYGNQVVYLRRTLWPGVGVAPQGSDLVVFSTMRFYLP
jgi:hypothetical protein